MMSSQSPPRRCPPLQRKKPPRKPLKLRRTSASPLKPGTTINNNLATPMTINDNLAPTTAARQAKVFAEWFRNLIDEDRSCLGLYIADDAILHWFGRTVKSKRKVAEFLKYDMHCTSHRLTNVAPCRMIMLRGETVEMNSEAEDVGIQEKLDDLAVPLDGGTPIRGINDCLSRVSLRGLPGKRTRLPSSSPELYTNKKLKSNSKETVNGEKNIKSGEKGQGDCLPSTSGGAKNKAKDTSLDFLETLPRRGVEATCVIEYTRSKNTRGADMCKWERPCKLQVAYSEDPFCVGDYIVRMIVYSDSNKCRRNLMAAFDAVSKETEGQ